MESLPDDIWLHILARVPPRDVVRFGNTCKPCRALALRSPVWNRLRMDMKLHPPKPRAWKLKTSYHVVVASACFRCMSRRRLHRQAVCSSCVRSTPLLQKQWQHLADIRREQKDYSAHAFHLEMRLRDLQTHPYISLWVSELDRMYENLQHFKNRVQALQDRYLYHQQLWVHSVDHVLRSSL